MPDYVRDKIIAILADAEERARRRLPTPIADSRPVEVLHVG